MGQLVEARQELTRALFLEPTLVVGYYLLKLVRERAKDAESARRCYRNAMAHRKDPPHDLARERARRLGAQQSEMHSSGHRE